MYYSSYQVILCSLRTINRNINFKLFLNPGYSKMVAKLVYIDKYKSLLYRIISQRKGVCFNTCWEQVLGRLKINACFG